MNDLLFELGYDDIDLLRDDVTRGGIDDFVYHAWDDYSTSIDGDALGKFLSNLFPWLANTWTGNW
jgi:hypothetical protein